MQIICKESVLLGHKSIKDQKENSPKKKMTRRKGKRNVS